MNGWRPDGEGGGTLFRNGLPAAQARMDLFGNRNWFATSGAPLGQDRKTATGTMMMSATGALQGTARKVGDSTVLSSATGAFAGTVRSNLQGGRTRTGSLGETLFETRAGPSGSEDWP